MASWLRLNSWASGRNVTRTTPVWILMVFVTHECDRFSFFFLLFVRCKQITYTCVSFRTVARKFFFFCTFPNVFVVVLVINPHLFNNNRIQVLSKSNSHKCQLKCNVFGIFPFSVDRMLIITFDPDCASTKPKTFAFPRFDAHITRKLKYNSFCVDLNEILFIE